MECNDVAFGWGFSGLFYGFLFAVGTGAFSHLCYDAIFRPTLEEYKEALSYVHEVNEMNENLNMQNWNLRNQLSGVYSSFETFKNELMKVGVEKYENEPLEKPPPAERTETYFSDNSVNYESDDDVCVLDHES